MPKKKAVEFSEDLSKLTNQKIYDFFFNDFGPEQAKFLAEENNKVKQVGCSTCRYSSSKDTKTASCSFKVENCRANLKCEHKETWSYTNPFSWDWSKIGAAATTVLKIREFAKNFGF